MFFFFFYDSHFPPSHSVIYDSWGWGWCCQIWLSWHKIQVACRTQYPPHVSWTRQSRPKSWRTSFWAPRGPEIWEGLDFQPPILRVKEIVGLPHSLPSFQNASWIFASTQSDILDMLAGHCQEDLWENGWTRLTDADSDKIHEGMVWSLECAANMPQSQHWKSVRVFLGVRGLVSCLACNIIKFESVFSHCLLSNPRISCRGVFWWILVRPICLGERGGTWHKGKCWKNNDENSADEIPDEIEINEISRHNMAQQSFLYSLRVTLATYHLPFVSFQVVSGRYPGVLLWDWNESTPQPLFLQARHINNQLGKPSGGWSKFLDPNTAKEYWWHDSGRPPWCVGGDGSLKKTFFQHGTWFQFKCGQIL